jgi:transcriptional regulator with XRE-family HTH domain
MALSTGNQLKAARALAGVDQQELADSAGVNVNTIRNMEARGAAPITSGALTVRNVQVALEALGIEFLNHSRPGVRLSTPTERTSSTGRNERATVKRRTKKRR